MAHDVFISYSSNDKHIADAVCNALEYNKIRCWIASRDVTPGKEWGEEIISAISRSKVMVLIFSSSANNSQQVLREVERAVNKNVIIVPFRI
ncbi:MAG: toll/interleukin-1 receptor domain-containing protein, partial [Halanaerobiales bacterium]